MLTLADASCYFDQTPVTEVTSGRLLFRGQVAPYDDSKRDSATAYRRVLSVKPGTPMPASLTVRILGSVWIIGGSEVDGLSEAHREKYVLHPSHEKFSVSRLQDYLAGAVVAQAWGDLEWVKDGKQEAITSAPAPIYNLYLPSVTDVREHDVLWTAGRAMIVSTVRLEPSGLLMAAGELLDTLVASATVSTRTYVPATGAYTAGASTPVNCLRLRWQALYTYDSQTDAKYQEGDCNLVFPLGTTVTTASTVTLNAKVWAVLSVETLGGALVVHGRAK